MVALNFVNQLEDKVHPATSLAGQEQGFVNGGSLACFTSQLSSVHRSDVNSTLLAQLAASEHHDRSEETDEWYKKYLYVLGKIGWVARP